MVTSLHRRPLGDRVASFVLQWISLVVQLCLVIALCLDKRQRLVLAEVLDHSLGNENKGTDQRQRQEDIQGAPGHIDPEVAEHRGFAPHEAADKDNNYGHAGGGGDEVVHCQSHHLREITGRRFTYVVLPVGIADKAYRRVQRQLPGEGRQLLRVEWQQVLQHQNGEECQEEHQVEEEHGPGITLPVHLLVRIHPADPVDEVSRRGRKPV